MAPSPTAESLLEGHPPAALALQTFAIPLRRGQRTRLLRSGVTSSGGAGETMFLNDHETATDLLYYESIAKTVVKLIRQTPDVPITVGVHGDWGAGKSSVLKMTESAFADDDRALCLWFNGWT